MNRPEILRQKIVKLVSFLTERKIQVTQRGASAFVEYHPITSLPIRVNLPYIADDATEEFMVAIEGFLDHEVGHILFTAAGSAKRADLLGVMGTWNAVEDTFIERKISEMFAGSKSNLSETGIFFLKNYTLPKIKENAHDPIPYLMIPAIRAWAGQSVFKDFMADKWDMLGGIQERLQSFCEAKLPYIQNSEEAIQVALEIKRLLEKPKEEKEDATGSEGDTPEDKGSKGKSTEKQEETEDEPGSADRSEEESDTPSDPSEDSGDDNDDTDDAETDDDAEEVEKSDSDETGDEAEQEEKKEDSKDSTGEDASAGDKDSSSTASSDEGEKGDETGDSKEDSSTMGDESDSKESGEGDADMDSNSDASPDSLPDNPESKSSEADDTDGDFDREEREGVRDFIDFEAIQDLLADYDDVLSEELSKASIDSIDSKSYMVYTKDDDYVGPLEAKHVRGVSDYIIKDMTDTVDGMVAPLQKDLERAIAARSQAVWTGGHKKGRINASALSKLTTFNDPRCFKQKQESKTRAVAVELVVDCSGSMDGTKIRTACYSAYALSSVLERMGIANEVVGFTTNAGRYDGSIGRKMREDISKERDMLAKAGKEAPEYGRVYPLFIPVLKSFHQKLTPEVVKGIAATSRAEWLEENVDGESILIAANRLLQRHEPRKIMIVLSDGSPACPGNIRALHAHMKDSVKQVEASGIEVLGIGIEDSSVTHFYKKNIVLNDVGELPKRVIGEIKRLLMQG